MINLYWNLEILHSPNCWSVNNNLVRPVMVEIVPFVSLDQFLHFYVAVCRVTSDLKVLTPNLYAMQLFTNAVVQMEFG